MGYFVLKVLRRFIFIVDPLSFLMFHVEQAAEMPQNEWVRREMEREGILVGK